jgi:drug/metabolite transporter (DMT)-like permease
MSFKDWAKFIILGLAWGSSFLWIKIAVDEVGPFTLVVYRLTFALLSLALVLLWVRPARPDLRRFIPVFLFLGLFNLAVPFLLISAAEQYIPSALAAVLNSTTPLFTILIAPFFLAEEKLTLARGIGLLTGFAGVVVLMSDQLGGGFGAYQWGILMMLGGTFSYAIGAVYARRRTQGLAVEVQATGQAVFAWLILAVAAPLIEPPFHVPQLPLTWFALAWLGIIGTCLGTILFYSLLHSVGPTRTTLVTYLFPLVGVFLGVIFLKEPLTWRLFAGGALIVSGVVVVNRVKLKK